MPYFLTTCRCLQTITSLSKWNKWRKESLLYNFKIRTSRFTAALSIFAFDDLCKILACPHMLAEPAPDGFDAVSVQNVGSTYIIVSWDLPTHSNGILINFSLYCNGALAGVLPLTVICYDTTRPPPLHCVHVHVLQSHPQALHSSWNVVLGVISAAASLPRPYGGAYSQSPIPQLEQDVGMGHLSSHPLPQTGNPGSITEIECTLLSGSAEQDALTMKESPLKNLILFFLRPHPSWGWLQND
eukprot:Em0017g319a